MVDEDDGILNSVQAALRELGCDPRMATSAGDRLPSGGGALLVVDVCPGGQLRLDAVLEARRNDHQCRIVAVTAYPSLRLAIAALEAGADDCLLKPLDPVELRRVIARDPFDRRSLLSWPSLAQFERGYIELVMHDLGGNISGAARTLKIRRSTLQRRLKKQPLNEPSSQRRA